MNLVGMKFSRWTVIAEAGRSKDRMILYLCKCDCGIEKIVKSKVLRSGESRSCGCYNKEQVRKALATVKINDRYGRLTVIRYSRSNGKRASLWLCKCDCGKELEVTTNHLTTGNTKSCGCLHKEMISGANSPKYNLLLTDVDRDKKRKYYELAVWRSYVFKRDNYNCTICNSDKHINAHHIINFSSDKLKRTDPDNGITLCKECHINFHKQYGYKNNNKQQLIDFIKSISDK